MVARRTDTIKRKRKEMCNSPLLDDSPKRTKVHAQRKFAQGSNVNSPVITPVKELESERSPITVLPEPVELLPIKRPNTEDFLTFLCFRGTPILPPSLNFFNTASIVDTNGQVHEIKSESPKNGPIDIAKCAGGSSNSEKPFIAFGVRKRADPIVISKQMDRKRRHALALQALRRKYQEQKMAKIRALTISKLSEKVTNKTLVRTNSVSKSETVMKKTTQNTIQKTKVKVVATKHVKVTTHTLKTSLRAKIQPKMCLRSFRGRFVQRELPFRKDAKIQKNIVGKRAGEAKNTKLSSKDKSDSEYSTVDEDEEEEEEKAKIQDKTAKVNKSKNLVKKAAAKIVKIISTPKSSESSSRVTRSGHLINTKISSARRQQIKKRILLNSPKAIVKPRSLRSTTLKKTQLLGPKNNFKTLTRSIKETKANLKFTKSTVENPDSLRKSVDVKKQINKSVEIKKEINVKKLADKKEANSNKDVKKEVTKLVDSAKKVNTSLEKKGKDTSVKISKNEENKLKSIKKINVKSPKTATKVTEKNQFDNKKVALKSKVKDEANLRNKKEKPVKMDKKIKADEKTESKNKKIAVKSVEKPISNKNDEKTKNIVDKSKTNKNTQNESKDDDDKSKKTVKKETKKNVPVKSTVEEKDTPTKKENLIKKDVLSKKDTLPAKKESPSKTETKKESSPKKEVKEDSLETEKKKPQKKSTTSAKVKPEIATENLSPKEAPTRSCRPSRKTKEAAAIYMELLSQKLVHERLDDEDNISIDSFPELPNVKRIEQRENELKAQAKSETKIKTDTITAKIEDNKKSDKKKVDIKKISEEKETEVVKIEIDDITITEVKIVKPVDVENEQKGKRVNTKRKSDDFNLVKDESKKIKMLAKSSSNNEQKSKESCENIKKPQTEDGSKKKTAKLSNPTKKDIESDSDDSINLSSIKKQSQLKSLSEFKDSKSKDLKSKDQKAKENSLNTKDQTLKSKIPKKELLVNKEEKIRKDNKSDIESIASSDINLKDLKDSTLKSKDRNFSDSDEEPLSKLTIKSGEGENSQKSIDPKPGTKTRLSNKRLKLDIVPNELPSKPKRECAKRPQNYLMFSSSESEDDYFYGFESKPEKKIPKIEATEKVACDLLSKDISRRFGKEKVNMSNEQIEKWLKDSAMAGNSGIMKTDEEVLKFGESIPTETTLDSAESIDTQKLKKSLLTEEINLLKGKSSDDSKSKKQSPLDRKPIFRKTKKESPNLNAFSPENESSVYAFGEDNEDVISTPFRRPSRRPSSTATSRSEDELAGKDDKNKPPQFRLPPVKKEEDEAEKCFVPPSAAQKKKDVKTKVKNVDIKTDNILSEDFKYKVPSSPSASSSSSAKLYKRQSNKNRSFEQTIPIFTQDFPQKPSPSQLVEGPVFRPTDQEFQDPLEYIERIRKSAEQFGICKIIPPSSFKPECKIIDDMRFTAYNQYVHKMLHRWGPNFKELMAIKKYLDTQNISLSHPPWIGGMEIDLPRLYQTVQTLGGLKEVIEKKKWPRVSECMKIPKSAQDRVTKLDDIYCKYLLPYDTLSPSEREKLFEKVETDWAKRESKTLLKAQQSNYDLDEDSDESETEIEECITKGRNMALSAFYRIARNTMTMHFKSNEPNAEEVEQEFWKHVKQRQNHICVHSGSIDSGNWGFGFAVSKNSPFARHAWNLKVLTNNSGSVLRSMGPIMGVTVPTLHVGMVFSACCWYRDPHGLPWIEYLHTGGNKIWYGIPNSASDDFQNAMKKLVPNYCRNKQLWLPSDTAMVPPDLLLENNVSLSRIVQNPGEFIVVFPKCFTSSISTGYVVSESVYFAPTYWLHNARELFNDLRKSCEPSMFSLERLILSIATDLRSNVEVLKLIIPFVQEICDKEKSARERLKSFGDMELERLPLPEAPNARKRKKLFGDDGEYECETCRMNLFVSMVFDKNEEVVYCLDHAIEMLESKKIEMNNCTLMFTYELSELDEIIPKIYQNIETKTQKKVPNKYAGMPTLLK